MYIGRYCNHTVQKTRYHDNRNKTVNKLFSNETSSVGTREVQKYYKMFIYLSKKVAIPPSTKINALAWNKEDGYIAVGGDGGLLRVLKLDSGDNDPSSKAKGLSMRSSLSMNETLEGHTENVRVIVWNEAYKRLTTSDENGVIVVWMLYKGTWCEEMINNRKKSTVADMAWSRDGKKICIVYEDGGVILGSVDGNRIWGKELKGLGLSKIQWSPDDSFLLFGLKDGSLQMYTKDGDFFKQLKNQLPMNDDARLVGLDWFPGKQTAVAGPCKALVACYANSYIQLMYDQYDERPIEVLLNKNTSVVHGRWNDTGSLLAVAVKITENNREINAVQFYNAYGEHLRTLRLPGQSISCLDWEGGSLRIALAIDSFVYFANVRPDYKWCYFNRTLVYASDRPKKRGGVCICYWNMDTYQYNLKYVPKLVDIAADSDACAIAARLPDQTTDTSIIICNTNGTVVEGYLFVYDVLCLTMNHSRVIVASKYNFIIWHYTTPKNYFHTVRSQKFKALDIDSDKLIRVVEKKGHVLLEGAKSYSEDEITCITCNSSFLLVGKQSGSIIQYSLPDGVRIARHVVSPRPYKLFINKIGSRAAIIDANGLFELLNISKLHTRQDVKTSLERKDVWSMCWASDAPTSFAIMEKTRMYVFKGEEPEEPITSTGYIFNFENLEIKAVMLDEIMENPEEPSSKHILHLEVKSLRDTRNLMKDVGIGEAKKFIEDNPHPRLWRQLAEGALQELDLKTAEYAFIRSENYPGILLIKKLQRMPNDKLHKAFIALFLKEFDKAEKHFIEVDRADLALKFRQTIGDWFRVIELIKTLYTGEQTLLLKTYNKVGRYFYDKCYWLTALDYYQRARNVGRVIECYSRLKDYESLKLIMATMHDRDPFLKKIARKFAAEDVFPEVVIAYERMGQVNAAKDYCIKNNRWSYAITLALEHRLQGISELYDKFIQDLLDRMRIKQAIEEYTKSKHFKEAAELCYQYASYLFRTVRCRVGLERIQRLYAYGAHMYWNYYYSKAKRPPKCIWKPAEACFLFLKCSRNIPVERDTAYQCMCLGLKMMDYLRYLPALEVCIFVAIAAYKCEKYKVCSRAFVKLQRLRHIDDKMRAKIKRWGYQLFKYTDPINSEEQMRRCRHCLKSIEAWNTTCPKCRTPFKICIMTGIPLISGEQEHWECKRCFSCALKRSARHWQYCPICKTDVKAPNLNF